MEDIKEILGNALFEANIQLKDHPKLNAFLSLVEDSYVLVQWPEVQDYMEEEWFEEDAVLSEDSSYLIPLNRLV